MLWSSPALAAAMLMLHAAAGGDADLLPALAALLVAGTYAEWIGGLRMQRRLAERLGHGGLGSPPGALPRYFWLAMLGASMFAGPVAFDPRAVQKPYAFLRTVKRRWGRNLFRFWEIGLFFALLVSCQARVLCAFVVDLVLPGVLGVERQWLAAVLSSRLWSCALLLLGCMAFRFLTLVGGVTLYAALEDRSLGGDLFRRLERVEADPA
jgi:hypothetical protein